MAELTRRALCWHGTSRRHLQETDEPNQAFLLFWNGGSTLLPSALQFFYLSSMFWLNSMCVDVWRAFRRLRSFDGGRRGAPGARSTGSSILTHSKLRWYALWSWGGPGGS